MTHLNEKDLVDTYYGESPDKAEEHLSECAECRTELARITELLEEVRHVPTPARGPGYGREVWARLEPRLPVRNPRWWSRAWILAPAATIMLVAAFLGGMLTVQNHQTGFTKQTVPNQAGISEKDRQRVFMGAMSDHLERSEILLAQLMHASADKRDFSDERARARDLLDENRLLRETASRSGDHAHAALLDDLERVFIDLANTPAQLSPTEIDELRSRVEDQGLLFKVRVTSTDARSKGQTL